MKTRIIEATDGVLYGKFLLGRFDTEWQRRPQIHRTDPRVLPSRMPLLRQEGWGPDHLLVLDLSSHGLGSVFLPHPRRDPAWDVAEKGLVGLV
mgnify:CR=1 FL=1